MKRKKVQHQNNASIPKLISLGVEYLTSNEFNKSREQFDEILKLDSMNGLAYCNLGKLASKQNNYKEAVTFFEQCLKYTPENLEAIICLGTVLRLSGRADQESTRIHKALGLQSIDIALFNEAWSFMDKGEYERVYDIYTKILQNNRQNVKIMRYIGRAFKVIGLYEKALEIFNTVAQLDSDTPLSYYDKYVIFQKLQKDNEAIKNLDKTIEFYNRNQMGLPSYVHLLILKGCLCNKLHYKLEAQVCFEEALKLNPNSNLALAGVADALCRQEKYEEGLEKIEQALTINSENEDFLKIKLRLVLVQKNKELILSTLDHLLKINPENVQYYMHKAMILMESGNEEGAGKIYDVLLQMNPEHLWSLRRKVDLYRKLEKRKEEKETLTLIENIVKKNPESGTCFSKAILIKEENDQLAIKKEYEELDDRFGMQNVDWFLLKQSLESDESGSYDKMTIKLQNGKIQDIYFNITNSMGTNVPCGGINDF